MKAKISTKLSDFNLEFLRRMNINLTKADKLDKPLSYSDLLESVVRYFRNNDERYLELITTMEVKE